MKVVMGLTIFHLNTATRAGTLSGLPGLPHGPWPGILKPAERDGVACENSPKNWQLARSLQVAVPV